MRDRHAAAGDRDASADDRGQAVIEREQVDHRSGSEAARVMTEAVRAAAQPLPEEVTRAIADSRERIDSSRDLLDGSDQGGPRDDTPPDARPQSPGSPGPRGGSGERHRPEADGGGQRS
jgi:hypothetical protein